MTVGQKPLVLDMTVTCTLVSQLSVAVTVAGGGTSAIHSYLAFGGTPVSVGGSVSFTVITCMQLAVFVQASVTVCVRRIVPPQAPPISGPSEQL
jgi:hypothetical protein